MKYNNVPDRIPKHIAFIMDGNGRWAQKRLLPRKFGHREGVKTIRKVADICFGLGIECVSLYAFSTENKERPEEEVNALFALMEEYFPKFMGEMLENDVRITVMGDVSYFPERLRTIISEAVEKSKNGKRGVLNFALNYGSRAEIVRAANIAVKSGKQVTEQSFSQLLYTSELPEPDLIVRTGGEYRLSNFMLYQCAYSELCFSQTLWPDFGKKQIMEILNDYAARERRYGKIKQ